MTRQQALEHIRIAAFRGDWATATRVYIENRISRKAFNEAVGRGQEQSRLHVHRYANVNGQLVCTFCAHKWSL